MNIAIFYRKSEINCRMSVRQVREKNERNGGTHTKRCSLQYVINKIRVYYLGLEILHYSDRHKKLAVVL